MRGECFRFLAACFYQPKKENLCAENFLSTLVENLQEICPDAASAAQRMQESLATYSEEELNVEYARLFVGPFGLKAPPYGSIYLDNDHTVMGPSTLATIEFYEQEGLARDDSFHELPDHIVVELEFLYFLSYRQVEAIQKGEMELADTYRQKQNQFLDCFPVKWVPSFCTLMQNETDNQFYSALSDCVNIFIQASVTGD